ncbi:CAZyme family AA14 [Trichoderma aggressivum f. europaeum]|uniref:CAZyme family AA14 n=1 Tax=Trichoderma aggressivum f. europaeum TaxID=173218 RepID=A0AAE1II28_9HYPO|nr:CAZyme family AA14 [Trichoderma aggressivum f. europaeum]
MKSEFSLRAAALCGLAAIQGASAHLAAYTNGMYCPKNTYQGPLTNFTDKTLHVYDPLVGLKKDAWFLSKGRNCWLAPPVGVWEIKANSVIQVPWANSNNSHGYYADGKELNERPQPFSVTNPAVIAAGLVSSSGGINSPNMHAGNKSTAAGTAVAIAYKSNIWDVKMEDFVVFTTAPQTPFERLVSYNIPNLKACNDCLCATVWIPDGFGQQNMYMAPHKCKIINPNGGQQPKTPSLVPGPNVRGPKQMIAAFQAEGNNVQWARPQKVPTYTSRMGFTAGAQTDIF